MLLSKEPITNILYGKCNVSCHPAKECRWIFTWNSEYLKAQAVFFCCCHTLCSYVVAILFMFINGIEDIISEEFHTILFI